MKWLKLLAWLPAVSKLASIGKIFSLLPGGQIIGLIFGVIGSLAGLVVSFVRWLARDIEDAFKEPQRLLVRLACALAVLVIGFQQGLQWDADKVAAARHDTRVAQEQTERWREAHQKLLDDAKTVDFADKQKHQRAMAKKLKAESDERAKIDSEEKAAVAAGAAKPTAEPPVPERVRKPAAERKAARCKNSGGQPGLFGFQPIWGGALPCKAT